MQQEKESQKLNLTGYNRSARFMASSLSNLVNNLSEEICKIQ